MLPSSPFSKEAIVNAIEEDMKRYEASINTLT